VGGRCSRERSSCASTKAAKIIDIALLDHVIVGDPKADPRRVGHFSFREHGHL
jgi:DNA repair protein RadC